MVRPLTVSDTCLFIPLANRRRYTGAAQRCGAPSTHVVLRSLPHVGLSIAHTCCVVHARACFKPRLVPMSEVALYQCHRFR
jgi:hypothetical protein